MSHHPPHYPAPPAAVLRSCHQRHSSLHWQRLAIFGVLYFGAASTAVWLAAQASAGAWYNWLLVIPFYLLAAASLHGISLFTHEAVHGTLCENVKLNYALGAVCAWPVLQNFSAYRVLHLDHHAHLGDDGDPDHYANYTRWTWMVFTLNWLRLLVGYPVYIVAIPILAWRQGTVRDRIGIAAEVLAVVGIAVAVILSGVPWNWLLHGWLMPMVFINTMVNIRGMSQHTLLEHATDEVQGTRSILTGPLVRYFMCNENYHLEHHLYPGVPWHHLPELHQALREDLTAKGAPYISSYSAFVFEFLIHSLRRSPLGWHRH